MSDDFVVVPTPRVDPSPLNGMVEDMSWGGESEDMFLGAYHFDPRESSGASSRVPTARSARTADGVTPTRTTFGGTPASLLQQWTSVPPPKQSHRAGTRTQPQSPTVAQDSELISDEVLSCRVQQLQDEGSWAERSLVVTSRHFSVLSGSPSMTVENWTVHATCQLQSISLAVVSTVDPSIVAFRTTPPSQEPPQSVTLRFSLFKEELLEYLRDRNDAFALRHAVDVDRVMREGRIGEAQRAISRETVSPLCETSPLFQSCTFADLRGHPLAYAEQKRLQKVERLLQYEVPLTLHPAQQTGRK